jgi:hypothetical protein
MAHETRMHERGAEGGPVTITLAVPTPFAIDPARLVAWLGSHGWIECAEPGYLSKRGQDPIWIPLDAGQTDLREAIVCAADAEGLRPCALAALLAPPVEGPALQWAHASTAVREDTIATILDAAKSKRADASEEREGGQIKVALAFEAQAMGLEAAAAVLRGGGR